MRYILRSLALVFISGWALADINVKFEPDVQIEVSSQMISFALLGQAKREFLFFDVYDVANYAASDFTLSGSSPEQKTASLVAANVPKMLRLKYHRNISGDKVGEVLLEGFKRNSTPEQWQSLQSEVSSFLEGLNQDINKNDQLDLIWTPESLFGVSLNGHLYIESKSPLFLKTLWLIWFGERAVVDRADLFSH